MNALYNKTQFWDGRAVTLEQQAGLPIVNPVEMGQPTLDSAVARIAAIPEYRATFIRVFARPPNAPDMLRAIASYERSQVSFDSPFDHYMAGNSNAISASAKRGWVLFNKRGRCNTASPRWRVRLNKPSPRATRSRSTRRPYSRRCRSSGAF